MTQGTPLLQKLLVTRVGPDTLKAEVYVSESALQALWQDNRRTFGLDAEAEVASVLGAEVFDSVWTFLVTEKRP